MMKRHLVRLLKAEGRAQAVRLARIVVREARAIPERYRAKREAKCKSC